MTQNMASAFISGVATVARRWLRELKIQHRAGHALASVATLLILASSGITADWPMWRSDAHRGATTDAELPAELHLQWWKDLGTPQPAWPTEQEKLQFDASYEPVVVGKRIFVPSMIHDSVAAYSTETGEELWRYYTDGPVRFAPACAGDAVYFVSDDGHLYCVAQADGSLRWKLRGGPSDRKVLGNERLISTWAARGAPVVEDNVVYFTAGIWPFMGVFVHAVDAETGKIIWTNSGSGSNYIVQPHGSPAFAGVSPQGYLALTKDTLIVPGGRGVPAGYDKKTGEFLFCHVGGFAKRAGGYDVTTGDYWMSNRGDFCTARTGTPASRQNVIAANERFMLTQSGSNLTAIKNQPESKVTGKPDRRGVTEQKREFDFEKLWTTKLPSGARKIHLLAGNVAYASDNAARGFAIALPTKSDDQPKITAEFTVPGHIWNMIAADDRLFVITREGGLFCFGGEQRDVKLPPPATFGEAASDTITGETKLIARGANWKYLDDGSDQKQAWSKSDFDDSAWRQGRAELGYGDGDEATEIDYGGKARRKHITSYFRTTFDAGDDAFHTAFIEAKIDDGAVIYLNGQEAARYSMPGGVVKFDTEADQTSNESDYHKIAFDAKLLKPGRNVIAVEVHQRSNSSSDVSFDLELLATAKPSEEESPEVVDAVVRAKTPAGEMLKLGNASDGYCVIEGSNDVDLISEVVQHSNLHVIVLESDADAANALRRKLQKMDLLGHRVAVMQTDVANAELPPYLCHLIIAKPQAANVAQLFETLRPYGGTAVIPIARANTDAFLTSVRNATLPKAKWKSHGNYVTLTREGSLPESAPWTQQGASVANTMMSDDLRVKTPLGLLWFGGPSHEGILPRHGHGPTPQVVGGRLFIEGADFIRATDVYTGRLLWQRELPGVGMYYDNTGHHPGANAIGGNYVSMSDGIYVAYGRECLRLDPATGKTLSTFQLPKNEGETETPYFGYIGIYENVLIAGSSPMVPWTKSNGVSVGELQSRFAEGSARLVALNRETGKVLWQRTAKYNFRHNAICAGGGKIFCIDRVTDARLALLKRRGVTPSDDPMLLAIDATTGETAWQASDEIFGTWLTYSNEHDVLIQATASFRDRAKDEPDSGIAAYDAKSGKRLWNNDTGYGGPIMVSGERIYTQGTAFDLQTGEYLTRPDPITGKPLRWTFTRNYGCNTAIGCPNLLTFRSAAAGFYDLAGEGGTGNLGGFRSSCTSNLVPADGVLNAPDYTRTCTCSYQLQCSLAMVHMPQAETWTFQPMAWDGTRVQQIGINFGAPGDRRAEDETLWIDYPSVGGRSPDLPIQVEGEGVQYFRQHASTLGDDPLTWVAASGMTGARQINIKLAISDDKPQPYTVRIITSSKSPDLPEQTVKLQGKLIPGEADKRKGNIIAHTYKNISIARELEIILTPTDKNSDTLINGIEIIREK